MHTILHKLKEKWHSGREPGDFSYPLGEHRQAFDNVIFLLDQTKDLPHYVVTDEIIELSAGETCRKSFTAMVNAGVANLPFERMLIEWKDLTFNPRYDVTCFAILTKALLYECVFEAPADIYSYAWIYFRNREDLGNNSIASVDRRSPLPIMWKKPEDVTPSAFYVIADAGPDFDEAGKALYRRLAEHTVEAMCSALLLANTQGVEKEHVDSTKLDRARVSRGKPKVGNYTILKIGKIYDRDGKAHEYTGRHMPVHLRAGHVRNQPCGPGYSRSKLIWIDPVLVNYHPGDEVPTPHHEVTL